jgi:drug/metabolite transporter (DMT)-like permease
LAHGDWISRVSEVRADIRKWHDRLAYLVFAGSVVVFTANSWLIRHESSMKVGTYAHVSPVVAVILGYFAAGEPLGFRTIVAVCMLLSVIVITTTPKQKPAKVQLPVVGSDNL